MPSKSKAQQRFMGLVHAFNKGDVKGSEVSKKVKDVAKGMKKSDVKKYASTKHKGLPEKKKIKEQVSYIQFTKKAKESSARVAKNKERQREMNAMAAYKDKKEKGIKFYDKKGTGRIKAGKKVYD